MARRFAVCQPPATTRHLVCQRTPIYLSLSLMKLMKMTVAPFAARPMLAPMDSMATAPAANQRGFTMIELMVVISIAAILAALAVPSFRTMLNSFRQKSALGLLVNDLNQARAEAIKRNTHMLVCVRNAAGTDCATGTNWQAGWVVCADSVADGNDACDATTTANPNPISVRPALDPALTLTATTAAVRFNANSSAVASTLTLGGTWSGANARTVTIRSPGSITNN